MPVLLPAIAIHPSPAEPEPMSAQHRGLRRLVSAFRAAASGQPGKRSDAARSQGDESRAHRKHRPVGKPPQPKAETSLRSPKRLRRIIVEIVDHFSLPRPVVRAG